MSAVFAAKWPGICHLCGFSYEVKENVHYVNRKVCHENCHETDGSDFDREDDELDHDSAGPIERRTYLKRGTRKDPPICKSCNTIHPVEADCW